ncbi:hypothetical protein [Calothrix sp. CCY 0018]|uniref:hypothetical protein n=1 Tax=Calothrix sp. CCY 0018 TaxID=3103864 RepID=UPI0039C6BA32
MPHLTSGISDRTMEYMTPAFMYRTSSSTGGQMYPKEHKSTKYAVVFSNEM